MPGTVWDLKTPENFVWLGPMNIDSVGSIWFRNLEKNILNKIWWNENIVISLYQQKQ